MQNVRSLMLSIAYPCLLVHGVHSIKLVQWHSAVALFSPFHRFLCIIKSRVNVRKRKKNRIFFSLGSTHLKCQKQAGKNLKIFVATSSFIVSAHFLYDLTSICLMSLIFTLTSLNNRRLLKFKYFFHALNFICLPYFFLLFNHRFFLMNSFYRSAID